MSCTLTFIFTEEGLFSDDFRGRKEFVIQNALHVPNPGDALRFNAADFTGDPHTIAKFDEYQDGGYFYCDLHSKKFGMIEVEVLMLVYTEERFKEECPKLYDQVDQYS